MAIEIFDNIEQGTPEWHALRCGIPTASVFADLMAKGDGKMRKTLLYRLAGERLTGEPAETFSNGAMERGKKLEAEARSAYAMLSDLPVRQVAFIRDNDLRAGASPDALVGDAGGLEIKTQKAELMLATLERWEKDPTDAPPAHKFQIQGGMLLTGREWWDLHIYCHRNIRPATFRVRRDASMCAELRGEIKRFNDDLDRMVERQQRAGG